MQHQFEKDECTVNDIMIVHGHIPQNYHRLSVPVLQFFIGPSLILTAKGPRACLILNVVNFTQYSMLTSKSLGKFIIKIMY